MLMNNHELAIEIPKRNPNWRAVLTEAQKQSVPPGYRQSAMTMTQIFYRTAEGKCVTFDIQWSADYQSCEIVQPKASLFSRIKNHFTGNRSAAVTMTEIISELSDEPSPESLLNTKDARLHEELEALRREKEALIAKYQADAERLRTADAKAFAEDIIASGRAFPYEREAIEAGYAHCATNAAALTAFKAGYETRAAHDLTREMLIPLTPNAEESNLATLAYQRTAKFAQGRNREQELLELTPLGCAVLENQP